MSIIPSFKVGLLNAWILMVLMLAPGIVLPLLMNKEKWDKRGEGDPPWGEINKNEKTATIITHMMILPFTLIYSLFLPIKLGTCWFFIGLPIWLIAFLISLMCTILFLTAPPGEPISKGIYAISRHPWYFSFFLGYVGVGIACASWVFLLCGLIWIISWNIAITDEESFLIKKYGDAYKDYMERTPRWLGIPKSKG